MLEMKKEIIETNEHGVHVTNLSWFYNRSASTILHHLEKG